MPAVSKRPFTSNITGRVRKVKTADFLVPLFEAISNSIHAIEERKPQGGKIEIELLRQPRQLEVQLEAAGAHDRPITGFVVVDNGVGFTDVHMASFCEADSTLKAKLGGKGVGRFTWLKFFEGAAVESTFALDGKRLRRSFTFSTSGVDGEKLEDTTAELTTTVRLSPIKIALEKSARRSLDDVTIQLVEHFIAYFVTGAMPTLKIRDGAATKDVVAFYQESVGKNTSNAQFVLNGQRFETTTLRFYLGGDSPNAAFLCADKRVAEKIALGKRDPFFARRFTDDDLKKYSFQMFVQSDYLDKIVNDDRDGFSFPEPGSLFAAADESVTKDAFIAEILKIAHVAMSAEIEKLRKANIETVTSFISSNAPQYRLCLVRIDPHQERSSSTALR